MTELSLDAIDVAGALAEPAAAAAPALAGDTRLHFLRKAGLAGGVAAGGGAILSALAPSAALAASGAPPASFGKGDIGILNYALTLEYLEAAFYNEAKSKGAITDPMTQTFLSTVVRDENAHVALLKKALGSNAVKTPKFDFGSTTSDQATFQKTAYVLENTGVHAYLGQATNIKAVAYLVVAAEIVTIEARHAGAIALITGQAIAPSGPLDKPFPASTVLTAVKGTGFITG